MSVEGRRDDARAEPPKRGDPATNVGANIENEISGFEELAVKSIHLEFGRAGTVVSPQRSEDALQRGRDHEPSSGRLPRRL